MIDNIAIRPSSTMTFFARQPRRVFGSDSGGWARHPRVPDWSLAPGHGGLRPTSLQSSSATGPRQSERRTQRRTARCGRRSAETIADGAEERRLRPCQTDSLQRRVVELPATTGQTASLGCDYRARARRLATQSPLVLDLAEEDEKKMRMKLSGRGMAEQRLDLT